MTWARAVADLIHRITADIPADPKLRSQEQQARWVFAYVLDWHRREEKSAWWEYFRLCDLSAEDLLDERSGISGLEFIETVGGTAKAPIHRYRFAAQETELRGDEPLHCPGGAKFGTVDSISLDDRTIDVKKRVDSAGLHPEAVFAHKIIGSKELANSLVRLGDYVAENGLTGNGPYQAGRDLLLREVPRIGGDAIRHEEEAALDAALRIAPKLTGGILPIQGPPGTGKTFTGARMICELVKAGKRVGIVSFCVSCRRCGDHAASLRLADFGGSAFNPSSAMMELTRLGCRRKTGLVLVLGQVKVTDVVRPFTSATVADSFDHS
jgi:hypothetical protein